MYKITEEKIDSFGGIVILNLMINNQKKFKTTLTFKQQNLQRFLNHLLLNKFIEIKNGLYVPTQEGRTNLLNFYKKFWEFVRVFQVFSAVDLKEGVFAYEHYWNMSEDEFDEFIEDERWEDVRIAVAEFKKIDPIELVFMDKIDRGYFSIDDDTWMCITDEATSGIWNDIELICNNNIHLSDLQEGDAITNIINQGTSLFIDLLKQENELESEDNEEIVEEVVETTVVYDIEPIVIVDYDYYYYDPYYYDPYYDPYYVSPCFGVIIY